MFSQLLILGLLLPSITLALLTKSEAQVAVLPRWAVVEFINRKSPGTSFGKTAAAAVNSELAKTQAYDLQADESVTRAIDSLKIPSPPQGANNLLRLGEALDVSTIVTGEIGDYRVLSSAAGKQAVVQINVTLYDVASGLPVNGTVVKGESTVRSGDAKEEELIEDAIQQGASKAIREIQSRQLPVGTVLNTTTNTALINKGARSGFSIGQEVIVVRGRQQVATARVSDIEPDSSTIRLERGALGIQPGDKVRAIWRVPEYTPGISSDGTIKPARVRKSGSNSTVVTVLLVLGVVAALLSNGNSSSQDATSEVRAEPLLYPDASGTPAVKVSWSPNGFAKGNSQRAAWQVWRDDVLDAPVLIVNGLDTSVIDNNADRTGAISFLNTNGIVGGTVCNYSSATNASKTTATTGVRAGHPYQYSVELVYGLSSLDLPDAGNTGSSNNGTNNTGTNNTGTNNTGTNNTGTNNTGTNNTGTNNTGTNNTGTNNTGGSGSICYFLSHRQPAIGIATPISAPTLIDPANNSQVSQQASFHFSSVATGGFNIAVEYVVQLSTTPSFTKGTTVTVGKLIRTGSSDITIQIDTLSGTGITSAIRNATTLYYRVGARNSADKPGPVKDPTTGQRYVFSQWRVVTRTGTPPPPPAY